MPYLTIIRHAKAEPMARSSDADRALSPRGFSDATAAGTRLATLFGPPDRVLVSPALRTRQTLETLLAQQSSPSSEVTVLDQLYLAESSVLIDSALGAIDDVEELWLCAHNPGVSEMVDYLTGVHVGSLPTMGMVRLALTTEAASHRSGTMVYLDTPAAHRRSR